MKVNFSKVLVQATVEGDPVAVDFRKDLGNLVYSRAMDVALSDLGKEIYYKEAVDIPSELVSPLSEIISISPLFYPAKKALLELLTEKEERENGTKKTKTNR